MNYMGERERDFQISQNMMDQGLGPGGMNISTPRGLGQWVGYLMGPWKTS